MKVFIGWSGPMSLGVAHVLRDKLPEIIPAIEPFVSSYDIDKADVWANALAKKLREADFGIACITPYNIKSPWLNFEAGFLSKPKSVYRPLLAPFLFLVDRARLLGGPLERFQSTVYEKEDVFRLLITINNKVVPEMQLEYGHLKAIFEPWWLALDAALNAVLLQPGGETETGHRWLFTIGDLKRVVDDSGHACIMVVSRSPDKDFSLFYVKDIVKRNLERGVSYAILIAKSTGPAALEVIRSTFSSHPGQCSLAPVPDKIFNTSVATHYCLLNYECNSPSLRVFLELPVKDDQGFWMEATGLTAGLLAQRFLPLWRKYRQQPIAPRVEPPSDLYAAF